MLSNQCHDLFTVIKFTIRDMISRKSFLISTVATMALIVLGCNLPNIINYFSNNSSDNIVLLSDPENLFEGQLENLKGKMQDYQIEVESQNIDAIKTKIQNDEINTAILISTNQNHTSIDYTYLVDNLATISQPPQALTDALSALYTNLQISKLHLPADKIAKITPTFNTEIVQAGQQTINGNLTAMMSLSLLLFFAIYFCAYQVSSSITIEKTSKIIETLVTSTSPRTIVLGKTIGIGIVGLLQTCLFVITALISAKIFVDPALLNILFDLSAFTPYLALISIIYFILGYTTYALLYALTGSTVTKPEEIQTANTPVAIITVIGFYLAYFTLTDPTSNLNTIAALLPISSPFCMPLRIMMGLASNTEVLASIAILLVFCFIIAKIAIKIYSDAILNYGTRMTISEMLRHYKEK